MERFQELIGDRLEKAGLSEQKSVALEKLKVVNEKVSNAFAVSKSDFNSRRLLRAYPELGKASRARRKFRRMRKLEAKKKSK
jgi:hypothetical protein